MKIFFFVACFFFTTCAFAQTGTVLQSTVQPFEESGHPQMATQHAMAQESNLLITSSFTYAKGELPLSDFAEPKYETPLGDVARALRKEHEKAPKAVIVLDK